MKEDRKQLYKIFNSSLDELIELSLSLVERSTEALYLEVLINDLQGEAERLEGIVAKIKKDEDLEDHAILYSISNLRHLILTNNCSEEDIAQTLECVEDYPDWKGDVFSVAGFGYGKLGNHVKAKIFFKKAYGQLEGLGANRRALYAFKNYIAAESNIYPNKKLISEYNILAKKALKQNLIGVAGVAFMNLSRQYQKSGASLTALKYAEESIGLLSQNPGNLQYFLALAQKAHLLIERSIVLEARDIIDELKASSFVEIQNTVKFLEGLLSESGEKDDLDKLSPSWKERVVGDIESANLGKLEQKLLTFVSESPRDKHEIIEHLYGSNIDYHALENRFKNLIGRFRKKLPGVVVYEDGKYRVSQSDLIRGLKDVS